MDHSQLKERLANMSEAERAKMMEKMDKELDAYIDNLEANSSRYSEGWSEENWEQEMENHPFFASKLDEDTGSDLSPLMEGIRELKYSPDENTPEELAKNYKEDGNYGFKYKKYRIAVASYTEGLKHAKGLSELSTILFTNRAAAQFYLGNCRSSLLDTKLALRLSPNCLKALIRAAKCYEKLNKYGECIEYCDKVLLQDSDNEEIQALKKLCLTRKSEKERDERREAAQAKKDKKELKMLLDAFKSKKITFVSSKKKCMEDLTLEDISTVHPYSSHRRRVHFEGSSLVWPVIFMYPEFKSSDFIEEFSEDHTFFDHIEVMFGAEDERPSWDTSGHYFPQYLEAFFRHKDNDSLIKIDVTQQTLGQILSDKRFKVFDGLPEIVIVSIKSPFYKSFLK